MPIDTKQERNNLKDGGNDLYEEGLNRHVSISPTDFETILNPCGYLEDIHMDIFGKLLASISEFKMQSTLLQQIPEQIQPVPEGKKHIQILFLSQYYEEIGHWICIYYDGSFIRIYDSLNLGYLHDDAENFLEKLFPHKPSLLFVRVQQQNNFWDCGLFAIAFAVSILFNRDPKYERYIVERMRHHAAEMFIREQIAMFPTIHSHTPKLENKPEEKQQTGKKQKCETDIPKTEILELDDVPKNSKIEVDKAAMHEVVVTSHKRSLDSDLKDTVNKQFKFFTI